jgi:hypothetical protein
MGVALTATPRGSLLFNTTEDLEEAGRAALMLQVRAQLITRLLPRLNEPQKVAVLLCFRSSTCLVQ